MSSNLSRLALRGALATARSSSSLASPRRLLVLLPMKSSLASRAVSSLSSHNSLRIRTQNSNTWSDATQAKVVRICVLTLI